MRSDQKAAGWYLGRFQVVDIIKFFNRKLILAKEADGSRVFLQEIEMNHFVPPGIREVLRNFHHPHVVPIHDVIEENRRITLVHPPLIGEPLSMIVDPEHPMPPKQALRTFRKLLRTMVDLYNLPLPMTTTLDPRNVIMNEGHPYVLFLNFKKLSPPRFHEKWRELLYFLLTGREAEGDLRQVIQNRNLNIPPELKKLIAAAFDPRKSIHDVLALAEATRLKEPGEKKRLKKWLLYPAAASVLMVLGIFLGIEFTSNTVVSEPLNLGGEPRRLAAVSQFRLDDPTQVYSLSLPEGEPVRIRAELTREKNRSFTLALVSKETRRGYGIYINEQGKVMFLEKKDGEKPLLNDQNRASLPVQPGKRYILEMIYQPDEPLLVTVMDNDGNNKEGVLGPIPENKPSWVQFQGGEGTILHRLKAIRLNDLKETDKRGGNGKNSSWKSGYAGDLGF